MRYLIDYSAATINLHVKVFSGTYGLFFVQIKYTNFSANTSNQLNGNRQRAERVEMRLEYF